MYSTVYQGKVHDWKYKKMTHNGWYAFYIGDIYVGQVVKKDRDNSWAVISSKPCIGNGAEGFQNRYYASKFLLEIQSYNDHSNQSVIYSQSLNSELVIISIETTDNHLDDALVWAEDILKERHQRMNNVWLQDVRK